MQQLLQDSVKWIVAGELAEDQNLKYRQISGELTLFLIPWSSCLLIQDTGEVRKVSSREEELRLHVSDHRTSESLQGNEMYWGDYDEIIIRSQERNPVKLLNNSKVYSKNVHD